MKTHFLKLTFLFVVAIAIVAAYARSHPFVDFLVYWTGSHLFVARQNPYSLGLTYQLQQSAGYHYPIPDVMLCPPWALTFFTPLGYVQSYMLAWIAWFTILTAALAISSRALMDLYFGPLAIPEVSYPNAYRYLFAFSFYPALLALKTTQLGSLILLGVAGFLHFENENRPWLAGLALSLTMLKPHLVLLLYLVLLLRRQWRELAASATVVLAFTVFAVYWDSAVFRQYWELMSGPYPRIVTSGMFAGVRSLFQSHNTYPLQFVPPIGGLIWLGVYWKPHRAEWSWTGRMPVLMLASFMAAPYGFVHDQALLIIPITFLAASNAKAHGRISLNAIIFYTVINGTILLLTMFSSPWCIVPAPLALALLFCIKRRKNGSVSGLRASLGAPEPRPQRSHCGNTRTIESQPYRAQPQANQSGSVLQAQAWQE
jgi:Glycosyltransferase family 87